MHRELGFDHAPLGLPALNAMWRLLVEDEWLQVFAIMRSGSPGSCKVVVFIMTWHAWNIGSHTKEHVPIPFFPQSPLPGQEERPKLVQMWLSHFS